MFKDIDLLKKLMMMNMIPKEMFWAYEAVRRSGIWNMLCFHHIGMYYNHSDADECLNAMTLAYYKFIEYTNIDFESKGYQKLSKNHVRLIQELYTDLYKEYGKDYPEGIVNIRCERKIKVSI